MRICYVVPNVHLFLPRLLTLTDLGLRHWTLKEKKSPRLQGVYILVKGDKLVICQGRSSVTEKNEASSGVQVRCGIFRLGC